VWCDKACEKHKFVTRYITSAAGAREKNPVEKDLGHKDDVQPSEG